MKRFIILGLLIVGAGACTSPEREEWDSGGDATRAQQQQSEEERVDAVNDPVLTPGQGTNTGQPQPF